MKKIRIKLVRSPVGQKPLHRLTIKALGLKRINHTVEHSDTPQIRGMVARVRHLISVEQI